MSKTTFSKSVLDEIQIEKLLKVKMLTEITVTTASVTLSTDVVSYELTLTRNATIVLLPNPDPNRTHFNINISLIQDSTGGRVITWPSNVVLSGSITTLANTYSYISLSTFDNGITWYGTILHTGSLKQYVPAPIDPNLNYKTPQYVGTNRLINGSDDILYCHQNTIPGDMLIQVACPWDGRPLLDGWNLLVDTTSNLSDYYGMRVGVFWKVSNVTGRSAHQCAGCDAAYVSRTPPWFTCVIHTWRYVNTISPWGTSIFSFNGTGSTINVDSLLYNVNSSSARVILTHNRNEAEVLAPSGITNCQMSSAQDYFWPYASTYSFVQNTIDRNQLTLNKVSRVPVSSTDHNNSFKSFVFNGELKALTFGKNENVTYANRVIVHAENLNMKNMMPGVSTYLAGVPNQQSAITSYPNPAVTDSTKSIAVLRNGQRYVDMISPIFSVGMNDFTLEFYFLFPGIPTGVANNTGVISSIPLYDGINKTNGISVNVISVSGSNVTMGCIVGRRQTGKASSITSSVTVNGAIFNHCSVCRRGNRVFMHINGTPAGSILMDSNLDNFNITNNIMRVGYAYNTSFISGNDVLIDEIRFVNNEVLYTENVAYTRPTKVS